MNPKTSQAGLTLAIAAGSLLSLSLSLTTLSGNKLLSPLGVLAGGIGLAVSVKRDQKGLTWDDYMSAVDEVLDDTAGALGDWFRDTKPALAQVIQVESLPEPIRNLAEVFQEKLTSEDWVSPFVKKSKLVFGATRSGKTTWFKYEIADFYRRHPNGRLIICDMDFGSPDEDGNRNFWEPFGLPENRKRFIYSTYEEVFAAIKWAYETLQDRLEYCRTNQESSSLKWQRIKLLIDELPAVFRAAEMADKQKLSHSPDIKDEDQLSIWVSELLYRGLKQQIEVTFGAQNKAVEEIGLNLAQQGQLNLLCLGSTAVDNKVVSSIPGVQDSKGLIERLKKIRQIPGCEYAAIAKIGDEVGVKIVPHIRPDQYVVELPSDGLSDVDRWFKQTLTPELEAELRELAKEPKTTLKQVAEAFGLVSQNDRRNSNPRYLKVKSYWDDLRTAEVSTDNQSEEVSE